MRSAISTPAEGVGFGAEESDIVWFLGAKNFLICGSNGTSRPKLVSDNGNTNNPDGPPRNVKRNILKDQEEHDRVHGS